MSNRILIDL